MEGQVPLLRVARAVGAIYPEDPLPEAGVGVWSGDLNGWAGGERKRRRQVVLRLLADGLDEGELGKGKGSADSRLLEEDHAVAGPNHQAVGCPPGEAQARSEVLPMDPPCGAREFEALRIQVEDRTLVISLRGRKIQGIASAYVQ